MVHVCAKLCKHSWVYSDSDANLFPQSLEGSLLPGGAGRRKKCGVLVRLLHWRKTHIGNVTMQCIAMSCLSDFRTVIHSHWNCRANEHCYWNWLETWKGRKEKKHIHGKSGFSRFFSETNMMNTSSITADSRLEMHHPMRKNYMLICLCCQGSSPDSGPKALLSDTETPACSVTITNSCCLAAKCCGCLTVLCQRGFFMFHRRIWGFNQTTGGNGLSMVWAAAKNMFCSDSCAEVLHAVQDFLCFLLHGNRNNNTGIDFEGGLNDLTLPMKHQKSTCPIRFNPTQFCWSARAAPAVLRFAGMAPGVQIPHPLVCLAMTTWPVTCIN